MNRRSFLGSVLLASLALTTLVGCGGESGTLAPTGTISGVVVNGDPATATARRANTLVRAYRVPTGATDPSQGSLIAQRTTDENGAFAIRIPRGRYMLEADLPSGVSSTQFRPTLFTTNVASDQLVSGVTLGHVPAAP